MMNIYRANIIGLLLIVVIQSPLYSQENTFLKIYTGSNLSGLNIFKNSDNTKVEIGFNLGTALEKNISEKITFSLGAEYNSYNFIFVIPPDRFGNLTKGYSSNLNFHTQVETIGLTTTVDYLLYKSFFNYSILLGVKPTYIFNKETLPVLIFNNDMFIRINERSVELFDKYQVNGVAGFSIKKRIEKKAEIYSSVLLQQEITSLYKSDDETYRLFSFILNIGINMKL